MKNESADIRRASVAAVVGAEPPRSRWMRRALIALVAVLLAWGAWLVLKPAAGPSLQFETAEVTRGDLVVTVTATGTVQPRNQVDVGSELSGTIEEVFADFNDRVQRDQVLARLDTDRLQAQVIEARAALESARARQQEAEATVLETRLRFERCESLAERQLCSREDLDTLRAAQARARAAAASARAQVAVADATLEASQTDLAKAQIRSPIDGLVLQRQIEPGQTVAASLQAPVLFTLAEDLTRMELHVAVDEADVGRVEEGQQALFTVDAYPERRFQARITQVRFAPQTVEGVVTYETILSVDNADLALRPGMTATSVITTRRLDDVVLIPNAALRFTPPAQRESQAGGGLLGMMFRGPPAQRRRSEADAPAAPQVWTLRDGQPVAVAVTTGPSDGRFTQLKSGALAPGQTLIVDTVDAR